MSLDHYLTTEPAERQDALTPDEPEGCDCGQVVCDCDERCYACGARFAYPEDWEMGMCVPCRQARAEDGEV